MNHRIRTRVDVLGTWCASTVVLVFTSHQVIESASRLHIVLRATFVHDGDAAVVVAHIQLVIAQVVLHHFVGCCLEVCVAAGIRSFVIFTFFFLSANTSSFGSVL